MYKLLLVEDDQLLQKLYQEILQSAKFEVHIAGTVKDAQTQLQTFLPDLILLDIMLPEGMNGFDLLDLVKKSPTLQKIPVVILTALDSERKTALEMGAKDYVVKSSIVPEELINIVKKNLTKKWGFI